MIEILVKEGQEIKKNDPLVTIESDKSSVEVPSNYEGTVENINVKIGDKVSKGSTLATIEEKQSEVSEKINPILRPNMLIKYAAKGLPKAVPTIVKAVGKVAMYFISIIPEPIIPLRRTVIGATVNEKICAITKIIKLRLNIFLTD